MPMGHGRDRFEFHKDGDPMGTELDDLMWHLSRPAR
jgi:hypothetical protein